MSSESQLGSDIVVSHMADQEESRITAIVGLNEAARSSSKELNKTRMKDKFD